MKFSFKNILPFFIALLLFSCNSSGQDTPETPVPEPQQPEIKGADFSFLPEVRKSGKVYYNYTGTPEDMLATFKNAGGNTVRLRLWVNPETETSGLASVKALSQEIKNKGMKVLISLHYSDSWADPSQQTKPSVWKDYSFEQLKIAVQNHTTTIAEEIQPDYIQIGNEINNGFLWNEGNISNLNQFKALLKQGISAVKISSPKTKIILHYAGFEGADSFFNQVKDLDYDIIGISYYPLWHGKNLDELKNALTQISSKYSKKILIAETSYPFTLEWNDQTHNVIGAQSQLIPQFPATPQGQTDFLKKIKSIVSEVPNGVGFCYWGGEWTAYKGTDASDGSSWENQAFWDFTGKSLPVLDIYKND
ncbi:MAG: glycosyl hydrolase 53 family protein [Bergeyella sp.]